MDTTNRSTSSHIRKAEAMNKWPDSETGKASDKHPLTRIKIKFDYGVMLLDAVGKSDIEETLRLLELGADVNYANADGLTSLHKACVDENFPFVKALVDNGANIEACDIEGWTPLHAAACGSSLEIIKFLVNKGANIVAVNSEGQLPIDLTNDDQIENYLENEIVQKDIDLDEARESEEKIMMSDATKWMNEGKLVDLRDSQGATPLHVAASKGYLDVIKVLMSIGADPNSRDIEGWTPLHAAVKWGNEDICRELIANGADLECLNNNNETPIKLADNHMKSVLEELAVKYRINNMTRKKSPQYVNKTSARVTESGKPPLGILKIKQDKKKQETPTDKLQTAYSIPRPSQRAYSVTPVVAVAEIPESIPSKQTTSVTQTIIRPPSQVTRPFTISRPPPSEPLVSKTQPEPLVDEVSRPIRPPDIKISIPSSNNKDSRLEESSEKIQNLQQEIITLRKERESLLKIIDNLRSQLKSVENPSSKPESNIRLGITSIARPPIRK